MKKNSKHSLQFAVLVVGVLIAILFFALTNSNRPTIKALITKKNLLHNNLKSLTRIRLYKITLKQEPIKITLSLLLQRHLV